MQLRYQSGHTSETYVTEEAWRSASLPGCPLHPKGGCDFARHGSYARVDPPGTRIARWYCPQGHRTFSLLPDHLAARFPGTLGEIEAVVAEVERARSVEAAANALRPDDVTLATAVRWIRRRLRLVHAVLRIVVSLLPDLCLGSAPTVRSVRARLACEPVLTALRHFAHRHLQALPRPLGFFHRCGDPGGRRTHFQQHMGPDPPQGAR